MRSKAVFIILLSFFVALIGVTLFRPRVMRTVEVAGAPSASLPLALPSTTGSSPVAATGSQPPAQTGSAPAPSASAAADAGLRPLLDRPVRVVGLGWDALAPGVMANQGLAPTQAGAFASAGVEVALAPADSMTAVESAMARGGTDPQGADIAVVPLAMLVASYERLRALDPKVFYVVGWSRGREALIAGKTSMQSIPPSGTLTVAGERGTTAAYLALFTLELVGVGGARLELVGHDKAAEASFIAWDKAAGAGEQPKGAVVVTTADATRLAPIVAIAQSGWTTERQDVLRAWVRGWISGQREVRTDAAGSARKIGAMAGAPDALVLVQRLGSLGWATLADNARMAGLSGRGAVTTESLFQNAWRIWRDAGVLTTPPPETAATEPAIVASLIRSGTMADEPAPRDQAKAGPPGGAPALLAVAVAGSKLDEEGLVAEAGWVAGVFDRSTVQVTVRGARGVDRARAQTIVDTVADRFDVSPQRLSVGKKVVGAGPASIEVLGVR